MVVIHMVSGATFQIDPEEAKRVVEAFNSWKPSDGSSLLGIRARSSPTKTYSVSVNPVYVESIGETR